MKIVKRDWTGWNDLPKPKEGNTGKYEKYQDYLYELVSELKPNRILEVGFNAGHSSLMWLTKTKANVTSIDIRYTDTVRIASDFVKSKFPERFNFIHCDSREVYEQIKDQQFDMVIVDGGHGTDICLSDCNLALKLGAKYLLIDDVLIMKM